MSILEALENAHGVAADEGAYMAADYLERAIEYIKETHPEMLTVDLGPWHP